MKYQYIIIIVVILLLCVNLSLENFDETKINTQKIANEKIKEFDYEVYKPYINKYFIPFPIIDLNLYAT